MQKKSRSRRKIIEWQLNDQGANPLTARGRKWIKKEIKKLNENKLRKRLEHQDCDSKESNAYWQWVENHNHVEMSRANPDLINDDLNDTVDND